MCWCTDLGRVEAARSQPLPPLLLQRLLDLLLRSLLDPLLEGVQLRVEGVLVILQFLNILAHPLKRSVVTRKSLYFLHNSITTSQEALVVLVFFKMLHQVPTHAAHIVF